MHCSYLLSTELKDLGIRSGVVAEVHGLTVKQVDPELEALKSAAVEDVLRMSDAQIADNAVLEGYRELVRAVGRSLKRFPPAAENLLLQVKRTSRLPTINTAVDSYNIVVVRRMLALGVHDMAKIGRSIHFRLSPGGEPFTPVGSGSSKTTQSGDFVYADDSQVLAWLDSKDSDKVKISLDTKDLIIVIQGTARTDRLYNTTAAEEACHLVSRFCGGTFDIQEIK